MFGKRSKSPQPPSGPASGGGDSSSDTRFPWSDDPSVVACNLACGNIANNLIEWVTKDGRVHAETYVATAGAIAGYAVQQTVLAQNPPPTLHVATTTSGDKYLFGDPLNDMIIPKSNDDAAGKLWAHAAGGAVSAGLAPERLPSWENMFRHVSSVLGGPLEGRPSTGDKHQPAAPVRQLLAIFWPHVDTFFKADFDEIHRRFGPVPPKWWSAIAAFAVGGKPIVQVKDVLDPSIALTILMESAIYASKVTKF